MIPSDSWRLTALVTLSDSSDSPVVSLDFLGDEDGDGDEDG